MRQTLTRAAEAPAAHAESVVRPGPRVALPLDDSPPIGRAAVPAVRRRASSAPRSARHQLARLRQAGYLSMGVLSLATGLAGLVLPLLPSTVFVLIAAWAFARSSERLHARVLAHPRFGPAVRAWQAHGAIPTQAKRLALLGLGLSLLVGMVTLGGRPLSLGLVVVVIAAVAVFVLSRPDAPRRDPSRPISF